MCDVLNKVLEEIRDASSPVAVEMKDHVKNGKDLSKGM